MGALVGKVSNCVSMFTDVTIGDLCTVTQLTHTPQLGSGPGHSQWNWMLGLSGPRNKGEIIASAEKCQCLITLRIAASSVHITAVVCSSGHCAARSIETCSSSAVWHRELASELETVSTQLSVNKNQSNYHWAIIRISQASYCSSFIELCQTNCSHSSLSGQLEYYIFQNDKSKSMNQKCLIWKSIIYISGR